MNQDDLRITVVMCVYTKRRWDDITSAFDALATGARQPDRVLVVVDHNEELLEDLRREVAGRSSLDFQVLPNVHPQGLSGARNTAIDAVEPGLVAFLDDDARPRADWLALLVRAFERVNVVATGGRADPVWPGGRPRWFPIEFDWVVGCSYRGLPEQTQEVRNVIGCSMAFRTAALVESGGFVDGVGRIGTVPKGAEETELCIRLRQMIPGAEVVYEPDSVVDHRVSDDRVRVQYFVSRCFAEGLSKAQIGQMIGHEAGTASERTYVRNVLPLGVAAGFRSGLSGDPFGPVRAMAILVGLAATTAGYVLGRIRYRTRSHEATA